MKAIITLLFIALTAHCAAQGISGRIFDEKKEPLVNAIVQVYSSGGLLRGVNATDYDGYYLVKPLERGYYKVVVILNGYDTSMMTGIIVQNSQMTIQKFDLKKSQGKAKRSTNVYRKPLVKQDDSIAFGTSEVPELIAPNPGVYQSQRGRYVNIACCRCSGIVYVIDGVQIQPVDLRSTNLKNSMEWNERLERASTGYTFTRDQLAVMPLDDVRDVVSLLPGIYQARRGAGLSIFGARYGGTQYVVDGIRQ